MAAVELYQEEVTHLYHLMDLYKINIQPTDLAMFQTLGPTLRSLKECLDIASETKEENISRFSTDLEKMMSDLTGEVAEIRNRAQDPMVLNPSARSEMVIKFLDELLGQLGKIEALKKRYEDWAELFRHGGSTGEDLSSGEEDDAPELSSRTSDELAETKTEVVLKHTLWISLKNWEALVA